MALAFPILQGSSLSRDGGTQPYHVIELQQQDQGKIIEALNAAGLPQKNSPHPSIPGLKAGEPQIAEIHKGGFSATVNVPYAKDENQGGGGGQDTGARITGGSRLAVVRTQKDYFGNPIKVVWDTALLGVNGAISENSETAVKAGGEVDQQVCVTTVRFERRANSSGLSNSMRFVGKLNQSGFCFGTAGAWLCTEIGFSLNDDDTWQNTFEFASTEEGWMQTAAYIVPETGRPPPLAGQFQIFNNRPRIRITAPSAQSPGQQQYNGFTIVQVQGFDDFQALNLPQSLL